MDILFVFNVNVEVDFVVEVDVDESGVFVVNVSVIIEVDFKSVVGYEVNIDFSVLVNDSFEFVFGVVVNVNIIVDVVLFSETDVEEMLVDVVPILLHLGFMLFLIWCILVYHIICWSTLLLLALC